MKACHDKPVRISGCLKFHVNVGLGNRRTILIGLRPGELQALIRAAIFDYGDTLVTPKTPDEKMLPKAVLATYRVFDRAGLEMPFAEFSAIDRSIFGDFAQVEAKEDRDIPDIVKNRELVRTLFPTRSEVWRRRTASQANAAFWEVVIRNYKANVGAARSLGELASMGLKMVVLSNHHNHQALVDHLRRLDLDRFFLRIFSSSKLGVRKPDPRAFGRCLSALGVRSDEAVFIGDSIRHDMAGAKACGMKAILIETRGKSPPEASPADFTVSRLGEVPRIVRRLNE